MKSLPLLLLIFVTTPLAAKASAGVPTTDLLLWLRADHPGQRDESNRVEIWKNHALGSLGHATQSQPLRRPTWVASLESLGGQAALKFDGKDDFLHLPWLKIGTGTTVFIVAENTAQTAGGSYWRTVIGGDDDSFRGDTTKYAFGFRRADQPSRFVTNLYYAAERAHRLVEPDAVWQEDKFHIYTFRRNRVAKDGMNLRVDGAQVGAVTAHTDPPGFPGTGYTIGQGGNVTTGKLFRFYRGHIAEILVYDRPLQLVEILRVEEYLAKKYNLWRECSPPTVGLGLWLKADSLETSRDDETTVFWRDQSGRGHHALQSEPHQNPLLRPREINGRPALDFGASGAQLDFGGWRPSDKHSVFAAVRQEPGQRPRISRVLPSISSDWKDAKGRFKGVLAELLVFDRDLSSAEVENATSYLSQRYSESPDPRCFENGTLIFRNGYNDQAYVAQCRDGSWLCVMTTSDVSEQGEDRTLVVTRSRDQGHSWSAVRHAIEPLEMRQPSWATLYVAPYGRVYVFYNLREHPIGKKSQINYVYKYSDDHGETWSEDCYRMPIRKIALDREFGGSGGWSVCPPIEIGSNVLVSYSRYAPPGRSRGQGFVFRSDNLQSERNPKKIRWEMLPSGDHGVRANDVDSDMQEEHIITPLANGDLFCIWRTTKGYACQGYSRDGGRTWGECGPAVYSPGTRAIKQPLACCRPFRTSSGRYLLWFHNTGPRPNLGVYRPRDVVWLAGGVEKDGVIHWSQPEVFLYGFDLPINGLGMSYPDFVEEDGRFWVTTTDKEDARIFEIAPDLLDGLWNQDDRYNPPTDGLVLELDDHELQENLPSMSVTLPSLLHGGFTVDLAIRLDNLQPGQLLLDCPTEKGGGWAITTADRGALHIELSDGRNPPESWSTSPGLLRAGQDHQITFIVDGGPNLILVLVDGALCDGGAEVRRGWGRFSARLMDLGGQAKLRSGVHSCGRLKRLRLYDRPLRVAEACSLATRKARRVRSK